MYNKGWDIVKTLKPECTQKHHRVCPVNNLRF